jgi:hypothetical protein
MQWHTIAVTFLLTGIYLWLSSSLHTTPTLDGEVSRRVEQIPHPSVR